MTLEQKVNITTGLGWMVGPCIGNSGRTRDPDFPELCLQDSPLGIRMTDGVSSGVAGINAAASFDKLAIRQRGEYMGAEFRAKGIHTQLGPSMNMMRSPYAGRNWEAFGEDPYLVGVASAETIQGIQSKGVHSIHIDERTLHEVYLWPFARSVEVGVVSVMCAYNKFENTYACENNYILNHLLKGELGFKGFVQSDWSATHSTEDSANNGLDMTMPGDIFFNSGDSYFGANLTKAVHTGKVTEDRVTDMAMRIVASWYKGFPEVNFDSFRPERSQHVDVQENHKHLIRQMGAASIVLLKNADNILPLTDAKKLAIIGSDAGPNPMGLNSCADQGCNIGTLAQGWGSGTALFPYLITPLDGIRKRAGTDMIITAHLRDDDLENAARYASNADVALVFVNADSGEEFITVEGHKGDRNHLHLWHDGDKLVNAVADANKNTIVVIHSVGPVLMPWINHPNIKAIVWPGLPGQETGNSLADVLFGDVNPSGRLPYTIAKNEADYPTNIASEMTCRYSEGLYIGYRWFDEHKIEPLFEFGYGLSYTKFKYSEGRVNIINGNSRDSNVKVSVSITITNVGHLDGAEIPQLYLSFPKIANEPPQVLRGFEKVFIQRESSQSIHFELTKIELSYYDASSHQWIVPEGEFTLHIGSSSRDIKYTGSFELN
ncbi:glycoside hydrolase superfamily [Cokeromyces recurvatus]|uniref:glycoside hydrolase superfamily n=1 Tax=Cokeromyces recurvatus TaxID=90255 RepID=UPI00221F8C60|nr:glycoside hydrolase superfamily [Cokeromyces recurvatus]KAI7902732.1 glycoside hydrolase superfamily [Cokeromyces recurvatus]